MHTVLPFPQGADLRMNKDGVLGATGVGTAQGGGYDRAPGRHCPVV